VKSSTLLLCIVTLMFSPAADTAADIRLPSLFGMNMVIQRDSDVPVWGWADLGEKVTVTLDRQRVSTDTGRSGKWSVTLKPLSAGGPYELVLRGKNTVRLSNVLVGDVWICSGQSNMEMKVQHCADAVNEIADAYYLDIRLFQMENTFSFEPLDDCSGSWKECRPATISDFSATAYYFGREIHREMDVPVGLIHASWGGSAAETWMRSGSLAGNPGLRDLSARWAAVLEEKSPAIERYYHDLAPWLEDIYYEFYTGRKDTAYTDLSQRYGFPLITVPESPVPLSVFPEIPGGLYNGMIAPCVPFAIRGAIWYQGETNAARAYEYRTLFPALIEDWRSAWGHDFPFLFVQLANWKTPAAPLTESTWAELREAQSITLDLPYTAMTVTIDIGESGDIHPKNKQEVGRRLGLGALKLVYGRDIVHSGPTYDSMTLADGTVRLRFNHIGGGLTTRDKAPPAGFIIAGADRQFFPAQAEISGDEVVVRSDRVPVPVAVRYGWADDPFCTLCNREGLPASPFRTDTRGPRTGDE